MNGFVTRREFNHASLASLLAAITLHWGPEAFAKTESSSTASSRRVVIKQRLPGNPERQLTFHFPSYCIGCVHIGGGRLSTGNRFSASCSCQRRYGLCCFRFDCIKSR